ncbi:hypothetical protein LSCM1_05991 [Leishmania martiniquensis]|uniref:Uncharacterized protein n=1 Tax=Leishmania martiniquensis TaxID=1580590 RepID=A0A836GR73_9TRYP|nr:hypothetical protein LSCM1_05991 [Leishmania martiniquensis]
MWEPLSYISEALGRKTSSGSAYTLPSLYEYTTRLLFLEEEEEQLRSKIRSERMGWESLHFPFCDKMYSMHYCIDNGAKDFVQQVLSLVEAVAEDVLMHHSAYATFVRGAEDLGDVNTGAEVACTFSNCVLKERAYAREAYLCYELRSRLHLPPSVLSLLIEGDNVHFLMRGDTCTIPIAASIDSEGAPARYASCALQAENLYYTNGACRSCRGDNEKCFLTVIGASETGCTAALRVAETVCDDDQVESVLRTLADAAVLTSFACVYNDGTVYHYEHSGKREKVHRSCREGVGDGVAHRTRVVRGSRSADTMHLVNGGPNKTTPHEVAAVDRALSQTTLVATMRTPNGPFYFEVLLRASPIGGMSGTLLLSFEHDSPLHNNVLKEGDELLLLHFSNQEVWRRGPCRQWVVASKCDIVETQAGRFSVPRCSSLSSALLFNTERSFVAGDSAVVIGTAVEVYPRFQCVRAAPALFSTLFRYTPFVCKFLHRLHGPIGFVAYSFALCSSSPLMATALFPRSLVDVVGAETDVDPAVMLYFFRSGEDIFTECTYPKFTDALPFPLHHLTGAKANVVAGVVTCRLLEIGSVASQCSCYIMLSVSHVAFDGSKVLQFAAAGS